MKIAIVTEDEVTVSQHFGRAPFYLVFTVDSGKIMVKEKRAKVSHNHLAGQECQHSSHQEPHGYEVTSQRTHASMAQVVADCQSLIAGGMGRGAYDSLKSYGVEPVVTDVTNIEEALTRYLEGKLPNLKDRLH